MIDKEKVREKISFIEKNLAMLSRLARVPVGEFTEESTDFHAAIRLLQVSIEAMTDIGNHIVARERLGIPKTYGEIFEFLAEAGIIPRSFTPTARVMVRFRNRVVHLYADTDDKQVYSILQNNLGDFSSFIGFIIQRYFAGQEDRCKSDTNKQNPDETPGSPPVLS